MQLLAVLALLCCVSSAQIICETQGASGSDVTAGVPLAVKITFNGTVESSYTADELKQAFDIRYTQTNRFLGAGSSRNAIISGVNLTLFLTIQANVGINAGMTSASFLVNYTDLGLQSRFIRVGGQRLASGHLCVAIDRTRPALLRAHSQSPSTGPNIALYFSEPVRPCDGGNIPVSAFAFINPPTTSATTLTSFGTSPSFVWFFSATDSGGSNFVSVGSGSNICDANGVPIRDTSDDLVEFYPISVSIASTHEFIYPSNSAHLFQDIDGDGDVDTVLITLSFAFNESTYPAELLSGLVRVDGQNVTNPRIVPEISTLDNVLVVQFDDIAVSSSVTLSTNTPTSFYGPTVTGITPTSRTAVDNRRYFIRSVTGSIGSNHVQVALSHAWASTLTASLFNVLDTVPFSVTGLIGAANRTHATLSLNSTIRSIAECESLRVYMEPSTTRVGGIGYSIWRPMSVNLTGLTRSVISRTGTGAWDTLTLSLRDPVSTVAINDIQIQNTPTITYTVTVASLLSPTQVRYTVSQACANTSVSCVDTSPNIIYNLTIGSLSLTQLTTEYETAAPVFVGAAVAIGSPKIRVVTSEPVVGFSPSTAFTGVTVTAQSGSGSEYSLTLSRSVKETDLSQTWLESDLVDTLGNEATESALVFSVKATVHADDGDGLITRLRLTTNIPHAELSNSAAFSTIPTMTLGAVTRVSSTVSDIAITSGVALGSSVSVEYVSHSSAKLVLSSDTRGGLEIPLTVFPAESSTESADTGDADFSDLSTGIRALLISAIVAAFVLGIGANMCLRSSSSKKSQGRAYQYDLPSDSEQEMGERVL